MQIEKILEMLQVDKLDEAKQTEVKEKLDEIIDVKAKEKAQEKESEIREQVTEKLEEKFDKYKNDISEKFSNFVDSVLDEEMSIPDKIKEYARKGELYEEVIETLKTKMAIDEGMIDEEAKSILKECKTEISKMKEENNKLMKEHLDTEQDAKEFAAKLYILEKCDGMDLKKRDKVVSLLEGVTDKEKIDKKFDVIIESLSEEKKDETEVNENKNNGKGDTESKVDENQPTDPFSMAKSQWLNIINEGKW